MIIYRCKENLKVVLAFKLEQEDADKVRFGETSRSEFIRNINNGKYR